MIECYEAECKYHQKDEPFCMRDNCMEEERYFLTLPFHKEFAYALACAAACGMNTVTEALMNYEMHVSSCIPTSEYYPRRKQVYDSEVLWLEQEFGDRIPDWLIEEQDIEMEKYFKNLKEREDIDEFIHEVASEKAHCCKKNL